MSIFLLLICQGITDFVFQNYSFFSKLELIQKLKSCCLLQNGQGKQIYNAYKQYIQFCQLYEGYLLGLPLQDIQLHKYHNLYMYYLLQELVELHYIFCKDGFLLQEAYLLHQIEFFVEFVLQNLLILLYPYHLDDLQQIDGIQNVQQ